MLSGSIRQIVRAFITVFTGLNTGQIVARANSLTIHGCAERLENRIKQSVSQGVKLAVFKPAETRFVHHPGSRSERPGSPSVADIDIIVAVAVKSAAAGHHRSGLNAVRGVKMLVVDAEAERILFIRSPVDFAEGRILVGCSRQRGEEAI